MRGTTALCVKRAGHLIFFYIEVIFDYNIVTFSDFTESKNSFLSNRPLKMSEEFLRLMQGHPDVGHKFIRKR